MEFGLDQLQTGLRPPRTGSQTGSNPNSITLSWSLTGSKLVADLLARASKLHDAKFQLAAGLQPASNLSATRIA